MDRVTVLEKLLAFARQQLIITDCPAERKWWQARADEYSHLIWQVEMQEPAAKKADAVSYWY